MPGLEKKLFQSLARRMKAAPPGFLGSLAGRLVSRRPAARGKVAWYGEGNGVS